MKQIVVVEDDKHISEIISFLLFGEAYAVNICSDKADFEGQIKKQLPDLIILDIMLPDGNGLDMCKELKTTAVTRHIPVILMSANETKINAGSCADLFIAKPFDIHNFKSKAESFLHLPWVHV